MLTKEQVITWLTLCHEVLEENKTWLTQLDTAIGDADHGNNMNRGFKKVYAQLDAIKDKDIGAIFKATAMTLISTVGGASGPLYGTFFLQAGNKLAGKEELTDNDVAIMLRAGLDGVVMRGKAQAGDKTMVDVLIPVTESVEQDINAGTPLAEALAKAVEVAEQGVKDTIPLVAKKGRASYLGERSRGHQDPGATSSRLIIEALFNASR
ncbi:MAG: dihydroxyacetone kinase subunit L [Candidatus Cyclonatronum sp.]|uniref:dihydroxyacetone kinase subunit DhaL n=1 Tax=Cyclonatronum sp. TaxID=3024185 RepID=UPI0025C6BFCC|nr:dihydroxyacetone kinase subunit DhaL [Cyclonatronum sp.]MCC5935116.1 dihydroxyacetone kinase subunit L [Balneolales bacterium]MCH8486238.1 dihydroxyacetone kinase subunit L [Cyclonatronum sp.]